MKKLSLTEATIKALEGKLVKKTEGKKGYKQGICPNCGTEIASYDPVEWYDDAIGYPFTCSNCGAYGQEYYNLVFDEIEIDGEDLEEARSHPWGEAKEYFKPILADMNPTVEENLNEDERISVGTKEIHKWGEAKDLIHQNPEKYIIVSAYWEQYAAGITGTTQWLNVYIPEKDWSKEEARAYANANNLKRKTKKGKPTPYGNIGAIDEKVFIIKGKEFDELYKKYHYYTVRYHLILNGE